MDVGDVLAGRYELLDELGAGGMGRVLRARDRTLERTVAVKLLGPHLLGDADAVAALRDEARRAAAVRHPNVVQVLDAVLDDTDQPAIVMEFVDGPSLRALVADGGMEVDEALEVLAAVGAGLAAVHAAGLVHRDVSPGNVLVDRDTPRLTDFGIARSATATVTGTIRGSVGYLAPEQASGQRVGPAADVYALGCLATTLLTGSPPFDAEEPVGVVHQHLNEPPPDLQARRAGVPGTVAAAISAALVKDPAERTASVTAFLDDLGLSTEGVPDPMAGTVVVDPTDVPTAAIPAQGATGAGSGTKVLDDDRDDQGGTGVGMVAPTGAGTTTSPSGSGERRGLLSLLAVGVLTVAAATTAYLAGDDGTPQVGASPSTTPSPTATAQPSPAPSPSPSPSPEPSLSPVEATAAGLQQLRTTLVDLRSSDGISAEALDKLDERAAEALDKLRDGKPNDVAKELREVRKQLRDLVDKGAVTPQAEEAVLRDVLAAERALDAVPRAQGDDDDDDDEEEDDD